MSQFKPSYSTSLQVSSNGRYFVDHANQPLFFLGDTQWELFRLFDVDTALTILRDRQAKGFNVILVMLTGVDLSQMNPDRSFSYTNLEGEVPWLGYDPLQPNEAYFQHIDPLIRLGELTGQTLIVGIYHKWHTNVLTLAKARPWARWVARRYREVPNLVWSMYPTASAKFIPVCRELAAGLQEGDGGSHLVCVHPDPSVASSSFLHTEPWLAFNMIQTCVDYDQIHATVTADYALAPPKPVVMAEGGYEGLEFSSFQTAHHIRKQAYWSQLSGGHHVYGHNAAWANPSAYETWLAAPGAAHLKVFRAVITSLAAWWDLVPDPSLFLSGMGSGFALNTAARSPAGRWILAYLSESCSFSLYLGSLSGSSLARAWWIDPTSGERVSAGKHPVASPAAFTTPAGWEDALLLIEPSMDPNP
jgi:hypothetical protein